MKTIGAISISIILTLLTTQLVAIQPQKQNYQTKWLFSDLIQNAEKDQQPNKEVKAQEIKCPKWVCSNDKHEISDELCVFYQEDLVIASSYFKPHSCFVSQMIHWDQKHNIEVIQDGFEKFNNSQEEIKKEIRKSVCQDRTIKQWKQMLQCDQFCEKYESSSSETKQIKEATLLTKIDSDIQCDYEKYYKYLSEKFPDQNNQLIKDWGKCSTNEECASKKCQCMPIDKEDIDGAQSKCTTSIYDLEYKNQFLEVCSIVPDEEDQEAVDAFLGTACMHYILIEFGQVLEQLDQNYFGGFLRCIQDFQDYILVEKMYEAEPSITTGITWTIILVGLILCISLMGCCIWWDHKKQQHSEKYVTLQEAEIEQ